jgi:glycosyltransferase involved in cell wall biosynthesis
VGREESRLKAMAGPTIEFIGRVSDEQLRDLYARCRAFLFAADEDFGIVPVEAQAYGRPVIAYGRGGSLETVLPYTAGSGQTATGILFNEQSTAAVTAAILAFEACEHRFDPFRIRQHAQRFDAAIFRERMREVVSMAVSSNAFQEGTRTPYRNGEELRWAARASNAVPRSIA